MTDDRHKAGVLTSHFDAWRRQKNRSPITVSRTVARYLPERPEDLPSLFDADAEGDAQRMKACAAAALGRVGSPHLEALIGTHRHEKCVVHKQREPHSCSCCMPYCELCDGAHDHGTVHSRALHAVDSLKPSKHESDVDFDIDRWITKATEYITYENLPQSMFGRVKNLIEAADPRNWAERKDFFLVSEPGRWDGKWAAGPWDVNAPGPLQLRETVSWRWNPQYEGKADNILDITDFKKTPTSISYRYALHYCATTKCLSGTEYGGIDIDDGITSIQWTREPRKSTWRLTIRATKRVRFERTRGTSSDEVAMLNLMAPAILSMLMQYLVYDGAQRELSSKAPASSRE